MAPNCSSSTYVRFGPRKYRVRIAEGVEEEEYKGDMSWLEDPEETWEEVEGYEEVIENLALTEEIALQVKEGEHNREAQARAKGQEGLVRNEIVQRMLENEGLEHHDGTDGLSFICGDKVVKIKDYNCHGLGIEYEIYEVEGGELDDEEVGGSFWPDEKSASRHTRRAEPDMTGSIKGDTALEEMGAVLEKVE